MKRVKRIVRLSVVAGEPTDGSGRVCIHLFIQDSEGSVVEPHVLHPVIGPGGEPVKQKLEALPTRGRLACDPKRQVSPTTVRGVTAVTVRTDDPRAATCPRCIASADYKRMMEKYGR